MHPTRVTGNKYRGPFFMRHSVYRQGYRQVEVIIACRIVTFMVNLSERKKLVINTTKV